MANADSVQNFDDTDAPTTTTDAPLSLPADTPPPELPPAGSAGWGQAPAGGTDRYGRPTPTDQADIALQMARVWKDRGWSDAAIHGALANALDESNLNNTTAGPSGERYLFQFNPTAHLGPYNDFVNKLGGEPSNPRLQADYVGDWVDKHMPGYGKSMDPYKATDAFMTGFERPADQTPGRRFGNIALAQRLYSGFPQEQGPQIAQNGGEPSTSLTKNVAAAVAGSQPTAPPGAGHGPFNTLQEAWAARPPGDNAILGREGNSYVWRPVNADPAQSAVDPSVTQAKLAAQQTIHSNSYDGALSHTLYNILGPVAMAKGVSAILGLPGDADALMGMAAHQVHRGVAYLVGGGSPAVKAVDDASPALYQKGERLREGLDPNTGKPIFPGSNLISGATNAPTSASVQDAMRGAAVKLGLPEKWTQNYTGTGWDRATDFAGQILWASVLDPAAGITRGVATGGLKAGGAVLKSGSAIGAGLGLGEANEALDSWSGGQMNPYWKSLALLSLGGAWNIGRIGAVTTAIKFGGSITKNALAAKNALMNPAANVNLGDPATVEGARTAIGDVLAQHTQDALDDAHAKVAALGQPIATEGGMNRAEANAARRDLDLQAHIAGKQALRDVMTNGRDTERQLWNLVPGDAERDYSGVQAAYRSMKLQFELNPDGTPSLNPRENFPYALEPQILGRPATPLTVQPGYFQPGRAPSTSITIQPGQPQTGLQPSDTLLRGRQLRTQIGQMLDQEVAKGPAGNTQLIGNLKRIDRALVDDMSQGEGSAELETARAFTRTFHEFTEAPEFQKALNGDPSDLASLRSYLAGGSKGASAIENLVNVAQLKYPGSTAGGASAGAVQPSPLISLYKDLIRRNYIDRVAPNGLVDTAAHEQFMGQNGFGPALAHPYMADVKRELDAAGAAGRKLDATADPAGLRPSAYKTRQAALDNWLHQPADSAINYMFKGRNSYQNTKTILDQLDADPTERAHLGLQTLVAEKALIEAGGAGTGLSQWMANPKNAGVVRAMAERDPGFLERMMYFSNPANAGVLLDQLTKIPGAVIGAKFGTHLANSGIGAGMVLAGRGAKIADLVTAQIQHSLRAKITSALISDPAQYANYRQGLVGIPARAQAFTGWLGRIVHEIGAPWLKYMPGAAGVGTPQAQNPNQDALGDWIKANGGTE